MKLLKNTSPPINGKALWVNCQWCGSQMHFRDHQWSVERAGNKTIRTFICSVCGCESTERTRVRGGVSNEVVGEVVQEA